MTKDTSPELREQIRHGAEWAEAHRDEALPEDTKISRPGQSRSVVFSVRLNPEELDALTTIADKYGIPASSLARGWILDGIENEAGEPNLHAAIDRLIADANRVRALAR